MISSLSSSSEPRVCVESPAIKRRRGVLPELLRPKITVVTPGVKSRSKAEELGAIFIFLSRNICEIWYT